MSSSSNPSGSADFPDDLFLCFQSSDSLTVTKSVENKNKNVNRSGDKGASRVAQPRDEKKEEHTDNKGTSPGVKRYLSKDVQRTIYIDIY